MDEKSIENLLIEAKELAQSEYAHFNILGRALTAEELKRSDDLGYCIIQIQSILDTFGASEN